MQQPKKHTADIFFVLSLFCLYTLSSLFLSVIGANIYERNVDVSETNYNIRTSALYLTEKARQSETAGSIRVDRFGETDALVLSREVSEQIFETWIYVDDGHLCEVLVPAGTEVIPGIGQKIMPLARIDLALSDVNLLEIGVTDVKDNFYESRVFLECLAEAPQAAATPPEDVPTDVDAAPNTEIAANETPVIDEAEAVEIVSDENTADETTSNEIEEDNAPSVVQTTLEGEEVVAG